MASSIHSLPRPVPLTLPIHNPTDHTNNHDDSAEDLDSYDQPKEAAPLLQ